MCHEKFGCRWSDGMAIHSDLKNWRRFLSLDGVVDVVWCSAPTHPLQDFSYWEGAFDSDLRLELMLTVDIWTQNVFHSFITLASSAPLSPHAAADIVGPLNMSLIVVYHSLLLDHREQLGRCRSTSVRKGPRKFWTLAPHRSGWGGGRGRLPKTLESVISPYQILFALA